MRNVLVTILATASTALAWYDHPSMVTEAQTTDATSLLPSSTATCPTSTGSATTSAHCLITRVTRAPSVEPTTFATIARSSLSERDDTRVYNNGWRTWISEYDGRMITVKPCVKATR
ncbi:hypothetical protein AG0111_0g12950 [Alternaria gaisen]|uniref:Uncharacterized protein n=1 Tax=Alternaria gaisen TaxID=167740 RepID=A0ACB6F346_9PLEO|nr:hypothetical protein AG0111_0g12950 [Alternaria gaisen]